MRCSILVVGVDQFCRDVSPNAPLMNVSNNVIGTAAVCRVSCSVNSGFLSTGDTETLWQGDIASVTSVNDSVDPPATQGLLLSAGVLQGDVVAIRMAFSDGNWALG